MLAAQTVAAIAPGLVPDVAVIAGESTIARTRRPMSVYRRITTPRPMTTTTHAYTTIWSIVTATPNTSNTSTGLGAMPGAMRIGWSPKTRLTIGGIATETPTVTTIFTSVEARRRKRKRTP